MREHSRLVHKHDEVRVIRGDPAGHNEKDGRVKVLTAYDKASCPPLRHGSSRGRGI